MSPQVRWVVGRCWLYCRRPDAVVTWVGPVHHDGEHAPMYACEPCLDVLAALVHDHGRERYAASATVGPL